jgi:adenylate cyclase
LEEFGQMERRLSAIFAADMVGYSRLMETDEIGTIERQKAHRKDLIDPAFEKFHGRIVKEMGDGILVEFGSVVDAVTCALVIQRAMPEREIGVDENLRIAYRIGINLGDVVVERDDLFGDGVNVAARLEQLSEPGGIYISGTVHDQIENRAEFVSSFLGEQQLKNISRSMRAYRVTGSPQFRAEVSEKTGPAEPTSFALPDKPSIAVLPFDNMSGDPDQEYFSDGIVEDIITGLSRLRWLFVIARNSSFAYKDRKVDIRQVGRELGVRYVLEGSVRKGGDRIRVTGQLIEAGTGNHLWAERYDGALADVFAIQDEITTCVVAAIEPNVRKAEIDRANRKRPDDLNAYDLYLRALDQAYTFSPEGRIAALGFLDAALKCDNGYAEAHGLAAWCFLQQFLWGGRRNEDRKAALDHAKTVAAAGTDDATTLAFAAFALSGLTRDHETSLPMIDRALAQNPSSAIAHSIKATIEMMRGHTADSTLHAEQSLRLSPFDPLRYLPENAISISMLLLEDHATALKHARRALEASPFFAPAVITTALCLTRLGRLEEAQATVGRLVEIAPDTRVATVRERFFFADTLGFDRVAADLVSAGLPQ